MNKQNKTARLIFLSGLVLSIILSSQTSSFASNQLHSNSKNQAYLEFTKIIYNKSVYTPYKLELLKRLAAINGIILNDENQEEHDFNVENSSSSENPNLKIDSFKKMIMSKNFEIKTYFVYLMSELSHSSDSGINQFTRNVLNIVHTKEYFDLFKTLLASKNNDDRIMAINGLTRIGNEKALNLLIQSYADSDFTEKKLLIENIGKFKTLNAISFNKETIKSEKNQELLISLYVNMINYGMNEYLQDYIAKLNDENINISKYATLNLNNIVPDIDYKYLKNIVNSKDGIAKLSTASYFNSRLNNKIYKLNASEIIKKLGANASDGSILLRITAIKTLCNTHNPEIVAVLRPYINDSQLSDTIINIILSSKNPELLPIIKEISTKDNEIIKFYSALTLLGYDDNLSMNLFENLAHNTENDNIKLVSAYIFDKLSENKKTPNSSAKKVFISYIKNFENTEKLLDIIHSTINEIHLENSNLKESLAGRSAQILPNSISNKEIESYLTSEDNWVKLNASLNLLNRNKKNSLKTIREVINQNSDPKLISAAIEIIGDYGNKSDIKMLFKKMENSSFARVKGNSSLAIIEIIKRSNY